MSTRVVGFRTAGVEIRKFLGDNGPQTTEELMKVAEMDCEDTLALLRAMREEGLVWFNSSGDEDDPGVWILIDEANSEITDDDAWLPEVFERMRAANEGRMYILLRPPLGADLTQYQSGCISMDLSFKDGVSKIVYRGKRTIKVDANDVEFIVNNLDGSLGMFIDAEFPLMMAIDTADFKSFKAEVKEGGEWATLMKGSSFVS